jgi:Thioredoxin
MLTPDYTQAAFRAALQYEDYLRTGTPDQRDAWARQHGRVRLTDEQRALIASFTREINILVSSGIWCGDCAAQVPMLDHIGAASPRLHLRILDRDEHSDLAEQIKICGGLRVPTVLFLNEDFEFLSLHGDKSLARMRARAAKLEGAGCALPGAAPGADEAAATLADWVREVEFAHLIARLSPKLRQRHAD